MSNFLIVDTYYSDFLSSFYRRNVTDKKCYDEHLHILMNELFGTADFYSSNLKRLGCQANEIIFNDFRLQYKWLREYASHLSFLSIFGKFDSMNRILNKIRFIPWQLQEPYKILKTQIDFYKPEILYIQDIKTINHRFLCEIKEKVKYIVGQIASTIPKNRDLKVYDLILTSFPHFIDRFKNMGVNAEYLKIAFEPAVWERIKKDNLQRKYNCTFVGGLTQAHSERVKLLEKIAEKINLDIWGYSRNGVLRTQSIRRKYHSPVWGIDMYRILAQSKITLNKHIDIAQNYANNMRLYESTGCGAMLITDYKDNLNELFQIGKEVVAYKEQNEIPELVRYYLNNQREREDVAGAAQRRTLTEHTYLNRMKQLLDIFKKT